MAGRGRLRSGGKVRRVFKRQIPPLDREPWVLPGGVGFQACPRSLFPNLPNVSLKTENLGKRRGEPDFEGWGIGLRMQVSVGKEGCSGRESDDLGQHWSASVMGFSRLRCYSAHHLKDEEGDVVGDPIRRS